MKRIGFKSLNFNSSQELKRELLFFDEIAFDEEQCYEHFDYFINEISESKYGSKDEKSALYKQLLTDLEFLKDEGLVRSFRETKIFKDRFREILPESFKKDWIPFYRIFRGLYNNRGEEFSDLWEKIRYHESKILAGGRPKIKISGLTGVRKLQWEVVKIIGFDHLKILDELRVRILCSYMANEADEYQELEGYMPIISNFEKISKNELYKNNQVLNIVLNKMPIPDDSVSWEQIIDFKKDEDSKRKMQALRSWMTKISYSNLKRNEIEEEVKYLLNQYEHRMKLHKMKYEIGNLELVVVSSLEVVENIIKLNWSKAAKSIFDIKKRKIDLMIGETKAPGKELAYISKTHENFR